MCCTAWKGGVVQTSIHVCMYIPSHTSYFLLISRFLQPPTNTRLPGKVRWRLTLTTNIGNTRERLIFTYTLTKFPRLLFFFLINFFFLIFLKWSAWLPESEASHFEQIYTRHLGIDCISKQSSRLSGLLVFLSPTAYFILDARGHTIRGRCRTLPR